MILSCRVQRLTFVLSKHSSPCHSPLPPVLLLNFHPLFSYLVQITTCSCSQSADSSCKTAPPLRSQHQGLWWWQRCMVILPRRWWSMTAGTVMQRTEQREKEASPNKVEWGWMCHSCPWSMEAVRWDNLKLSCQASAGCTRLSDFKEINNV